MGPPLISPGSPLRTPSDWSESGSIVGLAKTPLKEQQPNKQGRDWNNKSILNGKLFFVFVDVY